MVSHIYCFVIFILKMYIMALIVASTTLGTTATLGTTTTPSTTATLGTTTTLGTTATAGTTTTPIGEKQILFYP